MRRLFTGAICIGSIAVLIVSTLVWTQKSPVAAASPHAAAAASADRLGVGRAPWEQTTPQFSGQVLHWSMTHSAFTAGEEQDPANGRVLVTDVWELVGADGVPADYHARTTLPDGSLHQEFWLTRSSSLLVLGADYAGANAHAPGWCVIQGMSNSDALADQLPSFADLQTLTRTAKRASAQGETSMASASPPLPAGPNVSPSTTYQAGGSLVRWILPPTALASGITTQLTLLTGAAGRVIGASAQSTDVRGQIIATAWDSRSDLDVYSPAVVPARLYQMPNQIRGVCGQYAIHEPASHPQADSLGATIPNSTECPYTFCENTYANGGWNMYSSDGYYFPGGNCDCWEGGGQTYTTFTSSSMYTQTVGEDICSTPYQDWTERWNSQLYDGSPTHQVDSTWQIGGFDLQCSSGHAYGLNVTHIAWWNNNSTYASWSRLYSW
jgi:hypothetical protein